MVRIISLVLFMLLSFLLACSSAKGAYRESSGSMAPPSTASGQSEIKQTEALGNMGRRSGEQGEDGQARNPQTPILIYNSSISLEADEVDVKKLSGQIVDKTKDFKGYLSQHSSSSLTVRVPAKEFYALNEFIKTLAKVKYENATAQDITMQYTDLKIRLDVQLKVLKRYEELLKKSANVKEAVEVERELSQVTERVEHLKGQIRYYNDQIGFSTIVVNFQAPYSALGKETRPGPLGWVFYGLYVGVKWLFVWD